MLGGLCWTKTGCLAKYNFRVNSQKSDWPTTLALCLQIYWWSFKVKRKCGVETDKKHCKSPGLYSFLDSLERNQNSEFPAIDVHMSYSPLDQVLVGYPAQKPFKPKPFG